MSDYKLRQPDQKRAAVNALKSLNYRVIAAGDSYNDTGMLLAADAGFFFHAPPAIAAQFPQFPVTRSYAELTTAIEAPRQPRGLKPARAARYGTCASTGCGTGRHWSSSSAHCGTPVPGAASAP